MKLYSSRPTSPNSYLSESVVTRSIVSFKRDKIHLSATLKVHQLDQFLHMLSLPYSLMQNERHSKFYSQSSKLIQLFPLYNVNLALEMNLLLRSNVVNLHRIESITSIGSTPLPSDLRHFTSFRITY